jgi:predicted transcriptional regulator YdeE
MSSAQPIMKHIESFTVTGFTVRTQNSDEFNAETAKLPKLWERFHSSNPPTDTAIFSIYSDYESDANGLYSVTVGVTSNDNPSAELRTIKINSGNYLIFQGKGPMPQAVIETWMRVWDYFTADSPYQRCFMTDFEAYSSGDEVSIYIGVK